MQHLASRSADIAPDLGQITHSTCWKSFFLSSCCTTTLFCRHRKALSSFLESDGTSLPGVEGLVDAGWYMPPLYLSLLPLGSIKAVDSSVDNHQAYDVREPLFQQILSFSQRWKHVELSMPFSIYRELETGDAFPLLNSLRGNFAWNNVGVEHPNSLPVRFLEAPNLQRLSINSPQLSQQTIRFPPIWGRLIDFHFPSTIIDVDFLISSSSLTTSLHARLTNCSTILMWTLSFQPSDDEDQSD